MQKDPFDLFDYDKSFNDFRLPPYDSQSKLVDFGFPHFLNDLGTPWPKESYEPVSQETKDNVNPYALTEQDKELVLQLQEKAKQQYIDWIKPNTYHGYTPFDASPSTTTQEVLEKYNNFQSQRSVLLSAQKAYSEYQIFMTHLMNNLTPELRQNQQEMLELAQKFPEALLEIDHNLLTPEFAREAIRLNPDFYPTLIHNPKGWDNANELVQDPTVVTTYMASVVKNCNILNSERLQNELAQTTDINSISILPIHPETPLHQIRALDLYKELTQKAFAGEGIYSHSLTNPDSVEIGDVAIGPTTAAQLIIRDTFPELEPQFDQLEKEVYLQIHANIDIISPQHEKHLQDFAITHDLPLIQSRENSQSYDDGPSGPWDNR